MYATVKHIHLVAVALTLGLFLLRGVWMVLGSAHLQRRWVRIVPHVNDTVLLLSAIALCLLIDAYPFARGWLTAKVVGVVVYIGLGMVALRPGRSQPVRIAAWLAALIVFAYIASVARTHNPLPYIAG